MCTPQLMNKQHHHHHSDHKPDTMYTVHTHYPSLCFFPCRSPCFVCSCGPCLCHGLDGNKRIRALLLRVNIRRCDTPRPFQVQPVRRNVKAHTGLRLIVGARKSAALSETQSKQADPPDPPDPSPRMHGAVLKWENSSYIDDDTRMCASFDAG